MKTLLIGWLGPCPHCHYTGKHRVVSGKGNSELLYRGDEVTCGACGAIGSIEVEMGEAHAEWEDDE